MKNKVTILFFENQFGYINKIQKILLDQHIDCELISFPKILMKSCNSKIIQMIAEKINGIPNQNFIIFNPNSTELFCFDVDFTISFSAYKTWYDSDKMVVIPHLWPPNTPADEDTSFLWRNKPSLSVGFMGTSYTKSRAAQSYQLFPDRVKQWFLKGYYLRNKWLIGKANDLGWSLTYINASSRIQSLKTLEKIAENSSSNNFLIEIISVNKQAPNEEFKKNYVNHLLRNTYVLCPRGSENYSYRFYEALYYGRVPVVIDTDTVLPPGVNWEELAIIVDYDKIANLEEIISRDYHNKTKDDFILRQQKAIQTMKKLNEQHWVDDICKKISSKINKQAEESVQS